MTAGPAQRQIQRRIPWYHASNQNRSQLVQFLAAGAVGILLGTSAILIQNVPDPWAPFVLFALVFPFAAMIIRDMRKLLLAVIIFDIAFPVNFHLDYHIQEAAFGALGGLEISVTTIALPILYAMWLARSVVKPESSSRPRAWLGSGIPLALYVGFAALSMLAARDASLSFYEVLMLFQTLLMFIYIVGTVKTREDLIFVLTMLMLSFVLESVLMIVAPVGVRFKIGSIANRVGTEYGPVVGTFFRTAGTVGSPILAASYAAILIAPALGVLLTPLDKTRKWLAGLGLGLGSLALLLTFSRGGWIAAAVSTFGLCFFAWRRKWISPAIPLGIVGLALVMGLLFQSTVMTRVFNQMSAYDRIPLAEIAFRVIRDHPLLGVGANNIVIAERDYETPDLSGAWIYAIHDKYLLVWSETGIGALLAFVAALLVTCKRGWETWKLQDRLLSPVGLGLALAIGGMMIHMFVDVFNSRPQVQVLWLAAALITVIYNLGKAEQWAAAH